MVNREPKLNKCSEPAYIPSEGYCENQGSCVVVPVTIHNVCEYDHLLVIVEVYNGSCLYSRQIREVFVVGKDRGASQCILMCNKPFSPVSYCTNINSSSCNSQQVGLGNNNYYSGLPYKSSSNNLRPKTSNTCESGCGGISKVCQVGSSNNIVKDFYVGEFEFFFLSDVCIESVCVQVKTQVIYNC